jgi:hypothetical protein
MNMKAKMPCILALDLMESQAAMAMAAATFNSSQAPFSRSSIIESARRDASGTVISEARVVTGETFAKAAEGMLKQEGTDVSYQACFAAGTLVHTDKGLVPIEKIRVGTRVLSQPELGGALDYRRVTDRIATLDQIVFAVQVKPERSGAALMTLITTHGHPFWVETPAQNPSANTNGLLSGDALDKAKHWVAAEQLAVGQILQLADGTRALVRATGVVHKTQHADIGFVASHDAPTGIVLSLPTGLGLLNEPIVPASAERLDALENAGPLQLAEPLKATVYNLTVDEFHTYYVADLGVWVHNTYGGPEAVRAVFEKAAIEGECFSGDTLVVVEPWENAYGQHTDKQYIERIEVGDTVLSRCETTGEMAYKQVTKVFSHGWKTSSTITFDFGPEFHEKYGEKYKPSITTTANHPFWVQSKGWTLVRDLKPGDEMLTYDGTKATVKQVYLDNSKDEVYNLEVEDFHTYFVESPGIWVHNKSPMDFRRLDPNAVPDPKPQWTPQHKSEAAWNQFIAEKTQRKSELEAIPNKTNAEGKELTMVKGQLREAEIALREIEPIKSLGAADIQFTKLPDKNAIDASSKKYENGLHRTDVIPGKTSYPDGVMTSTRYPDLNGVVADIYQPDLTGSLGNTFNTIKGKSESQASVVVVDLREAHPSITMKSLLDVVRGKESADFDNTTVKGPIETLRTLIIIEKDGGISRTDFPINGKNP